MNVTAIEIQGLTRRFHDILAVDDLTLTVTGPGVFGFLGANGAGKTTTIRMLVGLIHPSAGEIRLLGRTATGADDSVRGRLGYLPQDPAFYPWMTGMEYMIHVGDLFGLPRKESRSRADELLNICGLTQAARRRIGGYSGGMKQRLGIAQALINKPDLLLLDEPVSALDPVGRVEVLDLVEELGKNVTLFMSSHILGDVERVCKEVAIIDQGRLLVHEQTASLKARAMRPILNCQFRGNTDSLQSVLQKEAWLAEMHVQTGEPSQHSHSDITSLRLTVRDLEKAQYCLPRVVADAGLGLVSLSPAQPTLEEVFIALVGKNRHAVQEKEPS